ncbi:carbohydrate esterase family 12 protein [Xylariaceae sp. FL0255]|nr:carbohydrate esterase family 12 protein [Xylariaceae sp. FL0255]
MDPRNRPRRVITIWLFPKENLRILYGLNHSFRHRAIALIQYEQYLAGDSTMAKGGGGTGTERRLARSYTREGRFQQIADVVSTGDFVVVEFGHTDGGSLTPTDNGRTDCFGDGNQTCQTVYDGVSEIVLTYPAYYENAARLFLAKRAEVILSSATPRQMKLDSICATGQCSWPASRFDYYAWLATSRVGGTEAGAYFVPHGELSAQAMELLDLYLANAMAGSFVLGLKCGTSALGAAIINSPASLTTSPYGPCITFNSTVPV